ncbi:unnamed protein product [Colletotrichum noveboracense]|uniref:Nephrocystin 3-like N-terminal domain-containing protein n=1 Tax=Colletotrichum noveboracense TaxID=2664923 RepID=A0A9W4RLX0_9PEZI|nr:unnamed protein product [Colletotrichum noveboracense]
MYHIGDKARQVLDNDRALCPVQGRPTLCYLSSCVYGMLGCYHRVRVIIDALDECTTERDLLSWMEELVSSPCSANSQLIVTGRPEVDFVQSLPRFLGEDNCIKFDTTEVNTDIHSYVSAQLENPDFKLKWISPNLLNEIRDKVGRRADGMFRWASCQMDNLALCLSARAIRTALRNLPRDLNETYSRMIESIPAEIKFDGIRLLQFLVYCERPLTVPASMDVIATRIDTENPFFRISRADFMKIKTSCASVLDLF